MGIINPYMTKATLALALEVNESVIDEMVQSGVLPKADRHKRGREPLWYWDAVDGRLQNLPPLGTIYAIGFGQYVKIGITGGDVRIRLAGFQTGSPEKLTIYGTAEGNITDERELHGRFRPFHTHGEWFRNEGAVAEWIKEGCLL